MSPQRGRGAPGKRPPTATSSTATPEPAATRNSDTDSICRWSTEERRRRGWTVDYLRGRGFDDVPARPVLRSDLRYLAHQLLDRAGGDVATSQRAVRDAAQERAGQRWSA